MTGIVFNIQRFSLFDGPGVRTVVFFKGCPLSCIWCHNPEGLIKTPQIMYDSRKCIGCSDCESVCPTGCQIMTDEKHIYQTEKCLKCFRCAEICPAEALFVTGREMTVFEVMDRVKKDLPVYGESGGGLTLSGGEPMFQPDFAIEILKEAKKSEIHTCMETSGFVSPENLRRAAEYLDVICYDYKVTGNENHKRYCGTDQTLIMENLSMLNKMGKKIILRCPIVTGINDNAEHINGICRVASEFKSISEIQLEPYHNMGVSKSKMLQIPPEFTGEPPKHSTLDVFCNEISQKCHKSCSVN